MPYRIKGTLKLPATSQPAAGVDIEFISRRNYSPLLMDLSSVIKTSPTGAYDVTLEYGEYAVVLYWGCNQPSHIGKLFVFADTVTGLDLQTLLQQSDWQPATPEYIQQIQDWLAQSAAAAAQAVNSAAAAKASELAAEADRAEVSSNKTIVVNAQADVTNKRNDVTAKAAQVAANTATVNEKTPLAVAAADTASQKAVSAATDAATASNAATRAENAAAALTGALVDGGKCNLSSGFYPAPATVAGKKYSTVWYVQTGGTVGGVSYDAGDVLRYTTADNSYFKVDAVDTTTAQINAHAAKVGAHPISGVAGLEAALADKADVSSVFEAAPLPDVWIPFNDSLRMITGFGDYDRVYIGEQYLELNSRSASFQRATTATYIDKSGVLRTAAINEPRFEKQGLLIEGQSTNLIPWSEPTAAQTGLTSVGRVTASYTSAGEIVFTASETTSSQWGQVQVTGLAAQAAGVMYSGSAWLSASKAGEYRLALVSRPFGGGAETGMGESIAVYLDETPRRFSISRATAGNEGQIAVRAVWISTGALGESVTMHRVQLEALPFASSYIPTNGTAVTRAADKCWIPYNLNMPNLNLSGSGVTICFSFSAFGGSALDNYIVYFGSSSGGGRWGVSKNPSLSRMTAVGFGVTSGVSYSDGSDITVCARWDTASKTVSCSIDGVISKTAGTGVENLIMPSMVNIGRRDLESRSSIFGHVRNLRIWHSALSDAQIKGLK